jgi:thiamine-phosphate pyrophosphorylase
MSTSPQLAALQRTAERLAARAPRRNGRDLPALLILTDPARTPDPVAVAERAPAGAGIVYRAFGAADALATGRRIAAAARRRDLVFLVGADAALAAACGAAGVHLPERLVAAAPRLRARRPDWILTGAAHGAWGLARAAEAGLDAALISAVFPSASPSAGAPLGPVRCARLARAARVRVYALGGVRLTTAARLEGAGLAGLALVGAALR